MIPLYGHYYFAHYMRLLQPQGKCYKGTKDKQEQLHIWIFFSNNFGPPVLFPIFNMRPVAYLLPRQFPFETKDGEEPCVFSESQSAINLAGSSLFSSSKVIVTEKGISASGNRIFYSKTGGEFNCSVVHTKTDGAVWYLANSHFFRMCFWHPFIFLLTNWTKVIKQLPDLVWRWYANWR